MFCIFLLLLSSWIEITYARGANSHMIKRVQCHPKFTVAFKAYFTCNGDPFSPDRLDIYQKPAFSVFGKGICRPNVPYTKGSFVNLKYTGEAPSSNYILYLKTTGTCNGKKEVKYNEFDDDDVGCNGRAKKTHDFGIIAFK
uniref:ZP domain-containing protein n=1 Tax=Parastrongyloides trichosuri TaxID=131310 RepID=A0A0N4ZJS7_PARTI